MAVPRGARTHSTLVSPDRRPWSCSACPGSRLLHVDAPGQQYRGGVARYPEPDLDLDLDLDDLFLFEAKRRVMKDRTVSLHGRLYEVDAILVGHSITLRYDPQAPASRPLQVRHDGRPAGEATRLDAYANTAVKRDRSPWPCTNRSPSASSCDTTSPASTATNSTITSPIACDSPAARFPGVARPGAQLRIQPGIGRGDQNGSGVLLPAKMHRRLGGQTERAGPRLRPGAPLRGRRRGSTLLQSPPAGVRRG